MYIHLFLLFPIVEHVPKSSMDDIMTYINYVHKNYFSDPEWHFNNEKILEGKRFFFTFGGKVVSD